MTQYNMLQPQDKVVVAVSGGPDSITLLYLLHNLATKYDITLHIAHLNHLLRPQEAFEEAQYVLNLTNRLNLPVTMEEIDIAKHQKQGESIQQTARRIRYEFFVKVAESVNATKIALGHQKDDNIETILMSLIRGVNPSAHIGIPPIRPINPHLTIIRPLIDISRSEIDNYLSQLKETPKIDSSNFKYTYFRNRVRLELMPLLEKYNPQIGDTLLRLLKLWEGDADYFSLQCTEMMKHILIENRDNFVVIDFSRLTELHPAISSRIIVKILKEIGHNATISFRHIDAILNLSPSQGRLSLPDGIEVRRIYQKLIIVKEEVYLLPLEFEYGVVVPGLTTIANGLNLSLSTRILDSFQLETIKGKASPYAAYLDYKKLKLPLYLRNRRIGDKFCPYGMLGESKKLKKFFIDLKLPHHIRVTTPLLVDNEKIVWVVGYRSDHRVRVTMDTKEVLEVKIIPKQD